MSAEEFKDFKESESEERVQAYFDSLMFKTFNIMVKGKFEFLTGKTVCFFSRLRSSLTTSKQRTRLFIDD